MAEKLIFTFLALILSAFGFASVEAKPVRVDSVEVELVADRDSVRAGEPFKIGLKIRHDPHWHTYWRNPGDSGLPTIFELKMPEGFKAGPIQWPAPGRIKVGPLTNFGYEGEILLPVLVNPPAEPGSGPLNFSTQAQWLVCKDVCIPGEAALNLTLPVARSAAPRPSGWSSLFESMAARTPDRQMVLKGDLSSASGKAVLLLTDESFKPGTSVEFYPYAEGLIRNSAAQPLTVGQLADGQGGPGTATVLSVVLEDAVDQDKLQSAGFFSAPAGILVRDSKAVEVTIQASPFAAGWKPETVVATAGDTTLAAQSSQLGLGVAMLFAAVGGLILNLMPCVFPVVGLKVLGFVGSDGTSARGAQALRHALAFSAGVIVSFWILAGLLLLVRSSGQALGWGFQLQSPAFVLAMALLFMVIGLNLSGLFEFGLTLTRLGSSGPTQNSLALNFSAGVLAVLVATPCTAPFMGSALGYTLSQPAMPTLAVFTAMALGMCVPYLLLGAFPGWLRWLPKPGRWMESLKQFLAFPMYAASLWLAWVLAQQAGIDAILSFGVAAIALALAAWIYGRFLQRSNPAGMFAWFGLVGSLAIAVWAAAQISESRSSVSASLGTPIEGVASSPKSEAPGVWSAWSEQAVERAIGQGKPVFVDFTASWCVSCQVNKKLVLERSAVIQSMQSHQVVMLRADWTQRNPQISAALARFGRNGVPLYVLYDPSGKSPKLLPELLTQSIVLDALAQLPVRKLSSN